MRIRWAINSKALILPTLVLALIFAVACGSSAVQQEPRVVEKEVIKEVEVVKEVVKEVEVVKQVVKEVIKEVVVTPTPIPLIKGQTVMTPLVPDWVAKGKYQPAVLEIVGRARIGQWDVQHCASLFSCMIGSGPMFNGLVTYNPVDTAEVTGDLAESWEISPDGATYTFKLADANWHDGRPVTSEDIQFNFDRITDPDEIRSRTSALKTFYERGTVKIIDDKTFEVPLKFPAATFLPFLAVDYYVMYAKHAVAGLSQEDANCCPENLLGSGPWKLKNWDRGTIREYERNTDYFKPDRPFFDGLNFNVIRDVNRIYAALQVEQAYITDGPWASTYRGEDIFRIQEETEGRLRAGLLRGGSGTAWVLHQNQPPFDDARVRRAFFLGLDRQNIVDIVYCTDEYGCFASQGTYFPVGTVPNELDMADVPGYRYVDGVKDPRDMAEAKKLLAEAGYPDGFDIDMNTGSSATSIKVAEVASEQMRRDFNIDMTLKPVDTATYHVHTREGTYPITLIGGIGLLIRDPADVLNQIFATGIEKNPDDWENPDFDKLALAQAQSLKMDERKSLFNDMAEVLRADNPHWVPNTWVDQGSLMDYRIQNFHAPTSIQHLHKWEHFWWDPDAVCPDGNSCTSKTK